jgi:hypothetical protein
MMAEYDKRQASRIKTAQDYCEGYWGSNNLKASEPETTEPSKILWEAH